MEDFAAAYAASEFSQFEFQSNNCISKTTSDGSMSIEEYSPTKPNQISFQSPQTNQTPIFSLPLSPSITINKITPINPNKKHKKSKIDEDEEDKNDIHFQPTINYNNRNKKIKDTLNSQKKAFAEIISTEKSYCKSLKRLYKIYFIGFSDFLSADQLQIIFCNLNEILELSKNFWQKLSSIYQRFLVHFFDQTKKFNLENNLSISFTNDCLEDYSFSDLPFFGCFISLSDCFLQFLVRFF